jgi:hypothetical protein
MRNFWVGECFIIVIRVNWNLYTRRILFCRECQKIFVWGRKGGMKETAESFQHKFRYETLWHNRMKFDKVSSLLFGICGCLSWRRREMSDGYVDILSFGD